MQRSVHPQSGASLRRRVSGGIALTTLAVVACVTTPSSEPDPTLNTRPPPIVLGADIAIDGPMVSMTATATAATPDRAWNDADAAARAAIDILVAEIGATRTSTAASDAIAVHQRFETVRERMEAMLRSRLEVRDRTTSTEGYAAEAEVRWDDDDIARTLSGLSRAEAEDLMRKHRAIVRDLTLQEQ